jgi:hypothetical protein
MALPKSPSRNGQRQVSGHFSPDVVKALKQIALDRDTTVQAVLGEAINDLFEKNRLQRLAHQIPLPRGGAALRAKEDRQT